MITCPSLGNIIYERATLLGRATRVQRVTVTRGGDPFPGKWALKVAWPDSTRLSGVEILKKAVEHDEKGERAHGHLPKLLCSKDLECTTAVIRKALGICEESQEERQAHCGPRTPRLIVFKELDGIETLRSDELLKAFGDVVDCHYALWISGIRHSDISPGNLMWNPDEESAVLKDYDLSRMNSVPHGRNLGRTGTIPFLSLDLLQNNNQFRHGGVEPTYNHDCDSLKWLFLYCVEEGSEVCRWLAADMQNSLDIRTAYLTPRLDRRPFQGNPKHEKLSCHGEKVYWLLYDAHTAVGKHNAAFHRQNGPMEYEVGVTNFELYNALKFSIRQPV